MSNKTLSERLKRWADDSERLAAKFEYWGGILLPFAFIARIIYLIYHYRGGDVQWKADALIAFIIALFIIGNFRAYKKLFKK